MKQGLFDTKHDVAPDVRVARMIYYCSVPGNVLINNLYSKVYPIHDIYDKKDADLIAGTIMENNFTILPTTIPNSYERIEVDGIYLIDNAEYIFLYILKKSSPELLEMVSYPFIFVTTTKLFGVNIFQ